MRLRITFEVETIRDEEPRQEPNALDAMVEATGVPGGDHVMHVRPVGFGGDIREVPR